MCFSLAWFAQALIWLIVIVAIMAIVKILVPWILSKLGGVDTGPLMAIINIVFWAFIAIAIVYFAVMLIGCLLGEVHGPLSFPRQ
jgi:hypothetical protein